MIAITATRNATDTMMPSSVKNARNLFARSCVKAVRMTSLGRTPKYSETVPRTGLTQHRCRLVMAWITVSQMQRGPAAHLLHCRPASRHTMGFYS